MQCTAGYLTIGSGMELQAMIDATMEHLLTLPQAAQTLPRRRAGRKVAASTIWRWARHGVRGVRLEFLQVGGVMMTSAEALQRFYERLTEGPGQVPTSGPRTSAARRKAIERADRELAAL